MKVSVQRLPNLLKARDAALVDFFSPACGPCKTVPGVLKQLQQRHQVDIFEVDVNEDIRTVGSRYDIRSLPTVILFRFGREIARTEGAIDLSVALRNFGPYL